MKVHLSLAFLFGGLLSGALAQGTSPASSSSTAADLTSLPPCALVCLSKAIVESPCAATNQTCLCLNAQLQDSVTTCVLASCTVKQALFTKNVTSTNCHAPIRDKTTEYNIISNTLGTISAVVVLLRLGFRQFVAKAEIGMDDWLILAALIFGIPSTVLNERGLTAHGLGRDVWTLPFQMVTDFGRYLYIMEVLYFLHINMFKLSMLFFYLRIFPAPGVRRTIWGTIAFTTVFCLTFIFLAIFQCSPISFFWDKWDGEHQGKCLNINAIPWANAAIGISLDLWMLAIPLWQLRDLNLHWKKKIGVAMMFCVGTFVTVVSILRLSSLVHFANSVNPTWDNWDISNWSTIEVNVGIICACMPSLRLILVRLFPKLMGSTRHYYANYGSGHASQNQKSQRSQRSRVKNMGNVAVSTTSSSNERTGPKGIVCQKTFAVDYGDRDNDEAQLVHMRDLNLKSGSRSESSL